MQDQATNPTLTADQKLTPEKITYDSTTQDIATGTGKLDDTDPKATTTTANKGDDVVAPTAKKASTIASETLSLTLSGCPSETDSLVKR